MLEAHTSLFLKQYARINQPQLLHFKKQAKKYKKIVLQSIGIIITVNDKSFEGEKFRGLLGSSGMWGKVFINFSITTFIYSRFSNSTKQLQAFQRKFHIPHMSSP